MGLDGDFVSNYTWTGVVLLGGLMSSCIAAGWMLGLRHGLKQDTRWAKESAQARRLKDLIPKEHLESVKVENSLINVQVGPPKESCRQGQGLDWPREVHVSRYGERFHLRPDCDALRLSTGVRRLTICKCCVKELKGA